MITRYCVICGAPFACYPSDNRVTCSHPCSIERKRRVHQGKRNIWTTESRKKLSTLGHTANLKQGAAAALELPEGQRGPQNREAMVWVLRDPTGREYTVVNLLDWARTHADLFGMEPGEASARRIASGIKQIRQSDKGKRQTVHTYKGWQLIDCREKS